MARVTCCLAAAVAVLCVAGLACANTPAGRANASVACKSLNFTLKAELMGGFGEIDGYSRNSGCGYKCGRKTFRWDNGPQGFGDNAKPGTTTQWPSTLNMAATFDPELALEWGTAMGEEFWGKGTNIQEGPGINIARIMRNGRTFEYVSGEDPILGSDMVAPIIQGIQKNVMSISKHYIENNQENHRSGVNEVVDEVTMMELYSPPFAAAARAGTSGFMCSYNRVNGVYACENLHTLKEMLKGYFGFDGFVVSDWGATHSTDQSLTNGLDIEMPHANFYSQANIQKALDNKNITMADIDDTCVRILSGWYSLPEDKRYPCGGKVCIDANVSTPDHKALARKLSAMSTVLLKNEGGLLPLSKSLKVALIGPDADKPYTAGQGSGGVNTNAAVSPYAAWKLAGIDVTYEEGKVVAAAVAAAKAADVAIVFGSAHSSEGHDRDDLYLGGNIDDVIAAVAAVQKKTVVVMSVPGSILTDWRDAVPAIVTNFLPGEQVGFAIHDILYGEAVPQAKLPITFPNKPNEQGMSEEQYPGVKTDKFDLQANYSEGQIVGYRWYDKKGVAPAFAFGHGLTYGAFEYSALSVSGRTISWTIKRTAGTAGCDTPQLYLGYPSAASNPSVPVKVLRYFKKVCAPTATLSYSVVDADVSNWDVNTKQWVLTKGTYTVYVGTSSQSISLKGQLVI
eukprot:m.76313 g.76313  ORF g.76313 m.76313 type:complete len:680 (+) comp14507_c2_seq1:2997-5036(+)